MLTSREIETVRKSSLEDMEERLPFMFQALGDPTRLNIIRLLTRHKDLCVTDIAHILNISVPAVSYQLRMLEVVGLVKRERMGKMICYGLKKEDALIQRILKVVQ
ncbi:MAG: winged helix-turn-helix transcriptional regulator [Candidatus Wildermuthbacteria bacterium]|nr:winged helix-turn-helix transcriptional regulator [Candidatus Wildermuthbacteria bacterium]